MITVRIMKIIALLAALSNLFGCVMPKEKLFVLDGPGMVYVDREHRTEYANTLSFDEIDDYPYWAVAYLGEGDEGEKAEKEYVEKLFSELSEEKRNAIEHYDYGSEKRYLVIPRYGEDNELIQNGDDENPKKVYNGVPYIVSCGSDVEIHSLVKGGVHIITLDTDENGRLIAAPDIWDITEYKN